MLIENIFLIIKVSSKNIRNYVLYCFISFNIYIYVMYGIYMYSYYLYKVCLCIDN